MTKPGRNDPCLCGSGKKFKQCCGSLQASAASGQNPHACLSSSMAGRPAAVPPSLPTAAEVNQLVALFNAGRHEELERQARRLLERFPGSGAAWNVLGVSLQVQGKDALAALRKATELLPKDPGAHSNLGNALRAAGQHAEAVASYRRALAIRPDLAALHSNLGNALRDLGQLDDAVASYRRALGIQPAYAEAHNNLGNALKDLRQLDAAAACYRRAIEIAPHYVEAHNNLGLALRDLGQIGDAVACYRRALEIKPDFAEAHGNLGLALQDLGQLEQAVTSYRRALEIKPGWAEAHSGLGAALQELGQLEDAVACYRRALEIKPDLVDTLGSLLFIYNYLADQSTSTLLAEARRFGSLAAGKSRPYANWSNPAEPHRRLRVGLVSGDLRNHPVGYFVEGMLAALGSDPAAPLEIVAYASHVRSDDLTRRVKALCHEWYSVVGLSDANFAMKIRDDHIDILVDLAGHTDHNRLPAFAWKPAPVQVSWLGYFATTGVAAVDYLIADPWTVPGGEETHFTEKIWRLPETYFCVTPPSVDVEPSTLPALAAGHITFGCFNNLNKMGDSVVALWALVLRAVPGSRLFLKTRQLGEAAARQSVAERFAAHGIDTGRLILEGAAPRAELLAAYRRVDIALDPFPYPGGTTSVEALWMGAPVLTLAGTRFLSHIGESILQNAGLPEWIALDAEDYVARAILHGSDLQRLAALREGLRQQVLASPIFDAPRFARHFEAALRGMWTRWCEQQRSRPS